VPGTFTIAIENGFFDGNQMPKSIHKCRAPKQLHQRYYNAGRQKEQKRIKRFTGQVPRGIINTVGQDGVLSHI